MTKFLIYNLNVSKLKYTITLKQITISHLQLLLYQFPFNLLQL